MHTHKGRQRGKDRLDELLRKFAPQQICARAFYWRLIVAARAVSQLLDANGRTGRSHPEDLERVVLALTRIAHFGRNWIRPPEAWNAPNANECVQFRALVNHLFATYPVPNFVARVWLYDQPWERRFFFHVTSGGSVRKFEMPMAFRLSKKAAGLFLQAPDDVVPIQALPWAQVRAFGGDDQLARLLLFKTVLAAPTEHEAFWGNVIRFLIRNAPLAPEEIVEIVSFIHQQRFQPGESFWIGSGRLPLQPELSIENQSLSRLRRHMINWRAERERSLSASTPTIPARIWERTAIEPLQIVQGNQVWTIVELLTDKELRVEGGIMQHCVATYIHRCACRMTSIWSMKVYEEFTSKRILTIEVDPDSRLIKQAKGKRNSPPSEEIRNVLQRWADQEGLKFEGAG